LRLQHRLGHDVLGRNQLDLILLARDLVAHAGEDRGIRLGQAAREVTVRLDVVGGLAAHAGSLAK